MFRTIDLSSGAGGGGAGAGQRLMASSSQLPRMGAEELGESWIELSSNTAMSVSAIGANSNIAADQSNITSNSSAGLVAAVSNGSSNSNSSGTFPVGGVGGAQLCPKSPDRTTTPLPFTSVEEYIRLLREAQRESKESSRVASLTSSRKNSPRGSPKSPPNSPNTELASTEEDLKGVYINYVNKDGDVVQDTDWVWDWSSRPDQPPPKDWKFNHPKQQLQLGLKRIQGGYSIRQARVGKNSLFSREVMYSLVLTNVLSLLLGAGIGAWLHKRGLLLTRVSIE